MTTRKQEQVEACDKLRAMLKPGQTLYTILKGDPSRSGMTRTIQVVDLTTGEPLYLGYLTAQATGMTYNREKEGVKAQGCGMDMGFEIVYNLGRALYPDGVSCAWDKCNSNDGGYAFRHRWL